MSDEGVRRTAVLLVAIGDEEAAEVLRHMGPREVQRVGSAIATLKNVPREEVEAAIKEFRAEASTRSNFGMDSDEYLRSVLTKALGVERASDLLERILEAPDNTGIERLKWLEPEHVAQLIKDEHPQIIATILIHLEPDQAAIIMNNFSERLRGDVMLRIATLEGVQPAAMQDLNTALNQVLSGTDKLKKTRGGGIDAAAEILNFMTPANESLITAAIKEVDADLAQKIQDKMFVFEDLLELDDRGIQTLLREVQSDNLILALKGTSEDLRNKIFKNMSQRAAEMVRDDLEAKGPVKLSEVEGAQREMLRIVRRLAEEGQVMLGGKGGEGLVQ